MKIQKIEHKIYVVRHLNVMFDFDLALLYQLETRVLKQSVRRNLERFPEDFMFQLTKDEWQEVITNCDNLPKNVKYSPITPFAFTEQGVAMLSSVLSTDVAVKMNISIIRAFVKIREYALTHNELLSKLRALENDYNKQFKNVYEALNYLLQKDKKQLKQSERKYIGYKK